MKISLKQRKSMYKLRPVESTFSETAIIRNTYWTMITLEEMSPYCILKTISDADWHLKPLKLRSVVIIMVTTSLDLLLIVPHILFKKVFCMRSLMFDWFTCFFMSRFIVCSFSCLVFAEILIY